MNCSDFKLADDVYFVRLPGTFKPLGVCPSTSFSPWITPIQAAIHLELETEYVTTAKEPNSPWFRFKSPE